MGRLAPDPFSPHDLLSVDPRPDSQSNQHGPVLRFGISVAVQKVALDGQAFMEALIGYGATCGTVGWDLW